MTDKWISHHIRDTVVDFVLYWSSYSEIPISSFVKWLCISSSKFYDWRRRYGKVNEHNARIPKNFWIEPWEKEAIINYHHEYPYEGYRRLTYMLMDDDIVSVSPSSVYRVLAQAELIGKKFSKKSSKGTGFHGPSSPHEHWHIDIAYLNIMGTFFSLTSILDGYSRLIVHWDIRESMTEKDVSVIVQRAKEKYPDCTPRIISDNGPQFIAKDFKELIRTLGLTHAQTSAYYPQSNGKKERFFGTLKRDCIRPGMPLSLEEAKELVREFIEYYNTIRLHSAIGYITPLDKLKGREKEIFAERARKLTEARKQRKANCQ